MRPHDDEMIVWWCDYNYLLKNIDFPCFLPTDRPTDGPTDGPTDWQTLLERCADASKNKNHIRLEFFFSTTFGFLDASSHLYMRVCPSVRPSVRPSDRRSVRPSVRLPSVTLSLKTGKSMILIANNEVSCNRIIIQSFHHHEDASLALWALYYRNNVLCL